MPLSVAVISLPPDILNVRSSPSTSLPDRLVEPEPSSSKDTSDTVASTGASFTDSMDTTTSAVAANCPSETLNIKLSEPLKSWSGV